MPRDVNVAEYRGVWVHIEHWNGEAADVSWELMGAGRCLAGDLGVPLAGVLLGHRLEGLVPQAFAYGADILYLIDDPLLDPFRVETHSQGFVRLIERYKPEIVLLGATPAGRELAGSVATGVAAGLTADTTELSIDRERRLLEATRPTFGGKQLATILCERWRPQMATVRPGVMSRPEPVPGRRGRVVGEALGLAEANLATRVLERVGQPGRVNVLDQAEIVIAGGRGLGEARNFALLHELAEALGGQVAATRAAVDAGWISRDYQIGQTGRTVRPKLYFAIGISGAIQHVVGMQQSEVVVAINTDPHAPIFAAADYGIAGDLFQVVPALTEEFRRRLRQPSIAPEPATPAAGTLSAAPGPPAATAKGGVSA